MIYKRNVESVGSIQVLENPEHPKIPNNFELMYMNDKTGIVLYKIKRWIKRDKIYQRNEIAICKWSLVPKNKLAEINYKNSNSLIDDLTPIYPKNNFCI